MATKKTITITNNHLQKYLKFKHGTESVNYERLNKEDSIQQGSHRLYNKYKPSWKWLYDGYMEKEWTKNE